MQIRVQAFIWSILTNKTAIVHHHLHMMDFAIPNAFLRANVVLFLESSGHVPNETFWPYWNAKPLSRIQDLRQPSRLF